MQHTDKKRARKVAGPQEKVPAGTLGRGRTDPKNVFRWKGVKESLACSQYLLFVRRKSEP